jgi:hypothetical protein
MRLGPVHVVVVAPHAGLRNALVSWLKQNKRTRLIRAVASPGELGGQKLDCDLVIASALEGTRDLRALSRRFGRSVGLVALSLGTTPLPAGWVPMHPGAAREHVLDHAVPHPERSVAKTSHVLAAIAVALAAVLASVVWVPETAVSFDRAALAYASRFPNASTWWHVWGAGEPYLASPSWPLLKLAALTGGGPEVFVLLAGAIAALFAVSFFLLALRAGARGFAVVAALAATIPPAVWTWPRGGDLSSLGGLTGVVLALAGAQVGRLRILTVALAVAVSSGGGYLWVFAAALAATIGGIRARRARASIAGAVLGILLSTAVTMPPILARGIEGLRPPLARPLAVSDVTPVLASAALMAMILAAGRARLPIIALAVAALVAANALALAAPVQALTIAPVRSTGAHGRLALHPAEALALAARQPDLPTTGEDVSVRAIVGGEPKETTNTRLEWLGADRAMLPDRSAAIVFNERDWSLLDRDRLLFEAPRVRPVLTAGITPTLLVVADGPDARVVGDALISAGIPSDRVIPVLGPAQLDQLTRETLREHTMLVIYGRPWSDIAKASAVLETHLSESGFVLWDNAARAGPQPLVAEAETIRADGAVASGESARIVAGGYGGRVTAMARYEFDEGWEAAALVAGDRRVIQYGQSFRTVEGQLSARMVWSGADLPARAVAGDERAAQQLRDALSWMLGSAGVQVTEGYGKPDGTDVLENELAKSTFLGPTHWRVELKRATTGILFKQRFHDQWRALQIDTSPTGIEIRTGLRIRPTAHGYMFVTLPPNARRVDFVFERHPFEAATRGVSAVAAFLTLAITFFLLRQRR